MTIGLFAYTYRFSLPRDTIARKLEVGVLFY